MPAGSATRASRKGGVASVSGASDCGSFKSKLKPVGLSAAEVSGFTLNALGWNRNALQPVTAGDVTLGRGPPFGPWFGTF